MVVDIVRYALLGLAGLLLIGSVVLLLRSLRLRASARSETYNVLRLNQRRSMVNQAFGSVGLLLLALILFAVGGVMSLRGEASGEETVRVEIPTLTPAATSISGALPTEPAEEEAVISPTELPNPLSDPTPESVSTEEPPQPTVEPTSTVPATSTPVPALVNSPVVGLYLRTQPSGDIIERLDDRVEVSLVGDEQVSDGLTWVLVNAPSGNQGWVAVDFLLVGQTAEDVAIAEETETPTPEPAGDG